MIPDEAVEAAHAAICEESLADHLDPDWRGRCVKAVEAAAPFLRAQALEDAAHMWRHASNVAHALRARAVTERGGE